MRNDMISLNQTETVKKADFSEMRALIWRYTRCGINFGRKSHPKLVNQKHTYINTQTNMHINLT